MTENNHTPITGDMAETIERLEKIRKLHIERLQLEEEKTDHQAAQIKALREEIADTLNGWPTIKRQKAQIERLREEVAILTGELIAAGSGLENLTETPELRAIHTSIVAAIKDAFKRAALAESEVKK